MVRVMGEKDKAKSYEHNLWLRKITADEALRVTDIKEKGNFFELNKKTYLYMAVDDFDSYCIYLEWNRRVEKQFYQPWRRVLCRLAQDLADRKIDFLGISTPPRVGKSTLCLPPARSVVMTLCNTKIL